MTDPKTRFTVSMNPKVAEAIEKVRGDLSRSLVIEAMVIECLGLPEEMMAEGRRYWS